MLRGFTCFIVLGLLATLAASAFGASRDSTLKGMLRRIDEKNIVIEGDNGTMTTVAISHSTKYLDAKSGTTKIGEFQPGDHVSISATEDGKRQYHAVSMTMVKEGTPDEHSAASMATDDVTHPIAAKLNASPAADSPPPPPAAVPARAPASVARSANADGPRLRRAGGASDSSTSTAAAPSAVAAPTPDSTVGSATIARAPAQRDSGNSGDSGLPQLRRAPAPADDRPATTGDSGPPIMRRAPAPADDRPAPTDAPVASSRPSLHADDVNGTTRMPPPPQTGPSSDGSSSGANANPRMAPRTPATDDDFIDQTREAAFTFSQSLPNYIVKQYTTRYATGAARGGRTSWQALDNVTADVIEENGIEKYKNILVNGRPPAQDPEKTGSWSRGEYSSLLLDVLSPGTHADFHGKRATTIANHAAVRYDFTVDQPNSHWHVEAESQSYLPAYEGTIWIDKENYRVLRIELSARDLPRSFPLDTVESAVDYDYVLIGEGRYLLPVHSEALSCSRGTSQCSRNVIEFRNYRKFTADSSITFDPN